MTEAQLYWALSVWAWFGVGLLFGLIIAWTCTERDEAGPDSTGPTPKGN